MCTYIANANKLKATKDMVVYKIVKKKFGKYYAPFRDVPYKDNKISSEIEVEDGWPATFSYIRKGIHSFTTLSNAIDYCNMSSRQLRKKCVIVKAIVPKGSTYYKGYTFMMMVLGKEDTNAIVSDSLVLTSEETSCYDFTTKNK